MDNLKIKFFAVLVIFFISLSAIKAQDRKFSLLVKLNEASIVHEKNGVRHTWYTWKNARQDERIPGQFKGHKWYYLVTNDQTIMKLDSATWELYVKITIIGDDGEKIAISYHSFDVPNVKTESKKFGWMNYASSEAGGYFYMDDYIFEMKFYEQPQDFKFKRIPDPSTL